MEQSTIETASATDARAIFSANADELHRAVKFLASKVVERRNTVPVLSGLHIEARPDGTVQLAATDTDLWAAITIAADVECPGVLCIDAGALADTLGKAKKGAARVTLDNSGARPSLKAGRSRFTLASHAPELFPLGPISATSETLPAQFSAAPFLADLTALKPCISTEESRYYLNGIAIQRRDLAGQERLVLAATDGHAIAVASRALPEECAAWADSILPRKAVDVILAAAKLQPNAGTVALALDQRCELHLGTIRIVSKLIDGEFPDWQRPFDAQLAPTGEADTCLFPDLLLGSPTGAMERLEKGAGVPIAWEAAAQGMLGTVPSDPGLIFGAINAPVQEPKKGFRYEWEGEGKARAYLIELAEKRGLPTATDMLAKVVAMAHELGERCGPYGSASRETVSPRLSDDARLQYHGGRIVGLTIAGTVTYHAWSERVQDWETLTYRDVVHPERVEALEGSYSILMPDNGPQLEPVYAVEVEGDRAYPLAINAAAKFHISADQVAALCGDALFATMAVEIAGRTVHVLQWLFDQGDSRFLTVQPNGRCFRNDGGELIGRDMIEAAIAGETLPEPMVEDAAQPQERESEPVAIHAPTVAVDAPSKPEWPANGELARMLTGAELRTMPELAGMVATWAAILETGRNQIGEPLSPAQLERVGELKMRAEGILAEPEDPLAAVMARLDAVEAMLATLSVVSEGANSPAQIIPENIPAAPTEAVQRREKMPAELARQTRIVRRYLAIRAQRDLHGSALFAGADYARRLEGERDMARQTAEFWRDQHAAVQVKRRRAVLLARQMQQRATERNHAYRAERTIANTAMQNEDSAKTRLASAEAELAKLKRDMADPSQPERASDVARLLQERDQARAACAALQQRCERAESARDTLADAVESMGTRLANAEAAVRRLAAA